MQLKKGICVIALAGSMLISGCGKQEQQYAKLDGAKQENEVEALQQETEDNAMQGDTSQKEDSLQQVETEGEKTVPGIICWGDSLTYGHNGERVSYPAVLEERLKENIGDIPVVNMGACGEDSVTIAGRSGGIPYVTAEAVTIPAGTEAVEVPIRSSSGKEVSPSLYTDVGINKCTIAGVSGTLSIQKVGKKGSKYFFTRNEAGKEVNVPAGIGIRTEASQNYKDYLSIVFIGTNGGYDSLEELIAQQDAIISSRIANTEKYLIVGITYGSAEGMADYDNAMYERYGEKYFCLRSYLSVFGMSDAGLAPTEEDMQCMLMGMVPESLRSDEVHFSPKGYEVVGNAIYEKLVSLGYFETEEQTVRRGDSFVFAGKLGAGVSIGNTLDAYGNGEYEDIFDYETSWHNPQVTPELFQLIKESGFETVRIPVTWQEHLKEDGTIDAIWLARVKEVVDYAYDNELYVIINIHHDEWYYPSYENLYQAKNMVGIVWKQIAECFKDYDEHLIFEGLNEPRLKGTEIEWGNGTKEAYLVINELNQCFIDTVRSTGGENAERYLMITTYRSGGQTEMLEALSIPKDAHILLSVHSYAPYSFAQDEDGTTRWSETDTESVEAINYDFECLEKFIQEKNVPVVLTEFGAVDKENAADREAWCRYFVGKAKRAGIPYIWWENNYPAYPNEGYAILDRWNNKVAYPEILKILTDQ